MWRESLAAFDWTKRDDLGDVLEIRDLCPVHELPALGSFFYDGCQRRHWVTHV